MKILYKALIAICISMSAACTVDKDYNHSLKRGEIFPDYTNVTIPCNIAPVSFIIGGGNSEEMTATFTTSANKLSIEADHGQINIDKKEWSGLLSGTDSIVVSITDASGLKINTFAIYVSADSVDSHIAYRLIEPGYEVWNEMGIYQRNIETYDEKAIITNKQTGYGCMNCHSFNQRDPQQMLFHLRQSCNGTYIVRGESIEKLNTKTPQTISALVYPSWHPSGRYVAFSTNTTRQMFHTTDRNRIEVFDFESDVVVYDVEKHEIISCPQLRGSNFETFPTFSPDGKTLYFCSADSVKIPNKFDKVKYSLCSISFNESNRTFGSTVDTIYNSHITDKSVSFPRISPDGRWLMYTLSDYGNFSIWHKEADLYMTDLSDPNKPHIELTNLNSNDVESYHSWSSNSRWVVFSSRRIDGLYTRPFLAHIDENGQCTKPFPLPQADALYYDRLMKSYNIPEFITSEVEISSYSLSLVAQKDKGIDLKYKQ